MAGHSTLRHHKDSHEESLKYLEKCWPPAIPFVKPTTKAKKKTKTASEGDTEEDETEDAESKTRTFRVKMVPGDKHFKDTYTVKVVPFEDGTPEEYCEWRTTVEQLIQDQGHGEDINKILATYRSVMLGKAQEAFVKSYNDNMSQLNEEQRQDPDFIKQLVQTGLNDIAMKVVFDEGADAIRAQKRYMRNYLRFKNMNPEKFAERLVKMNDYLAYFPVANINNPPTKLSWDELVDIIDYAKPVEWHIEMLSQGKKPNEFGSLEDAVKYYKQQYNADQLKKKLKGESKTGDSQKLEGKRTNGTGDSGTSKKPHKDGGGNKCEECGGFHPTNKCWEKPWNKDKRPPNWKSKKGKPSGSPNQETANVVMSKSMFKQLIEKFSSDKKKRASSDSGSEEGHAMSTSTRKNSNEVDNFVASLNLENDSGSLTD